MILTNKALNRRTMLRGFGAALALPLLDSMFPAFGGTAAPAPVTRLGFVYHPTGAIMDKWTPAVEGAGFEFSPSLSALAPFRDRILVLTGLAQVNGRALGDGPGDHAREGATWLTGVHPKRSESDVHVGVSADQIAAKELGKYTQLASLEISLESPSLAGACDQNYSCAYTNTVSWRTPTTPNPMESSFRAPSLNGSSAMATSADSAARLASHARRSAEHPRLMIGSTPPEWRPVGRPRQEQAGRVPGRDPRYRTPHSDGGRAEREVETPSMEKPSGNPDDFKEHAKLMIDLQVIAYQADLTRVVTFMFGAKAATGYTQIEFPDGHHSVTHHQNDRKDR